jgi:signal transduction histidine kinase
VIRGEQPSGRGSVVNLDVTLEDQGSERWRRALSSSVSHRWPRIRKLAFGSLFGAFILSCVLLVAVGYPTWRTAAFAAVFLLGYVLYVLSRFSRLPLPRWADDDYSLAFYFMCSLFTGGIHSPIVVAGLGPLTRIVQTGGSNPRPAVLRVVATSMAVGVLAVAPAPWVGPPLPHLAYAPSMLAFLIPTIVLHVWRSSVEAETLEGMVGQVFRAREEVASRALVRARDLELLTARMSEELKNPLASVRQLVDRSARTTPDPRAHKYLDVVSSEITRMQSILDEYLTFSRPLESLRPEPLRLGDLVDEVLGAMEGRAAAAGVALERLGDGRASADSRRITEALLNLVANAIEATPANGRVTVEIAERDSRVEIVVRDTGKGMSAEVLARLGSPFFTTRAQGTGLGVLLARSVFTRHDGSLEYESTPGGGTAAIASLPSREAVPEPVRAADG